MAAAFVFAKGLTRSRPRLPIRKKKDVDANYVQLMQLLLPSGVYHGIATHDPAMIAATIRFAAANNISKDAF